jgi:uncharacterized membrane protein YfcA
MTALALMVLSWLNMRTGGAHQMVTAVLSIALLLTAGALIARNKIFGIYSQRLANLNDRSIARLTIAMGAMLGILVTFSSVGAGAIGVTALVLLYPGVSTARIVGSDIAHAVPLTLIAGLGHGVMGSVDFHTLVSLLAGSLPGIFVGSSISARVPDTALRYVLAAVLIIVGSKLAVAESECCGGPYDTSFQIGMRSCSGGRARYGCNLGTPKVLSLKAPAKLLTFAEE